MGATSYFPARQAAISIRSPDERSDIRELSFRLHLVLPVAWLTPHVAALMRATSFILPYRSRFNNYIALEPCSRGRCNGDFAGAFVVDTVRFKYHAFLSYGHRDVSWAKWLHGQLEGFRLDKDLIGRETAIGPVPKTLRPIFRDREDFSGGHTLTAATVAAIDASAALIVLCSPVAATRPAVNEEVRLFRSRHPDRPVIPVIIEGTWPDNFPPALRFELAADGNVSDQPITILGPDLRESADGRTLGLAKVIAGLTGLGPDDIFRRAERARRRRTRIWAGIAGFCILLSVAATSSAVYARQQLKTNEAFLKATLQTATDIVNMAVAQAEKYNVPRAATLELLTRAEILFDNMARYGRPTPELQYQKALMLIQFARNYAMLGDTSRESADAEVAHRLLAALAEATPDDSRYQAALQAPMQRSATCRRPAATSTVR
jgi:hypothetical protein